jgi:type II secretory pathway pseudopilin PulG
LDIGQLKVDSFSCRYHPEREGVGICVVCKSVVCVECSTKIGGVNHCRDCLSKRATSAKAAGARRPWSVVAIAERGVAFTIVAGSVLLLGIVLVGIGEAGTKSRATRHANHERLEAVTRALRDYKRDTGDFPDDEQGLGALARRPSGVTGWKGPYLASPHQDAYGVSPQYRAAREPGGPCIVASGGGDRYVETPLESVSRIRGNTDALASGDDLVLFVD